MSQVSANDSNVSFEINSAWVQLPARKGGYGDARLSVGDLVTLASSGPSLPSFYKNGVHLHVVTRASDGESTLETVGSLLPGQKARILSIWKHTLGMTSAFIKKENGTVGQIPFHFLAPAQ